jgi:hypothetical protein
LNAARAMAAAPIMPNVPSGLFGTTNMVGVGVVSGLLLEDEEAEVESGDGEGVGVGGGDELGFSNGVGVGVAAACLSLSAL